MLWIFHFSIFKIKSVAACSLSNILHFQNNLYGSRQGIGRSTIVKINLVVVCTYLEFIIHIPFLPLFYQNFSPIGWLHQNSFQKRHIHIMCNHIVSWIMCKLSIGQAVHVLFQQWNEVKVKRHTSGWHVHTMIDVWPK